MIREQTRDGPQRAIRIFLSFALFALLLALFMNPRPAGAQDATVSVGDEVIVDAHSLNFRASADPQAGVNWVLLDGTWATITDGPVTAADYTWYELDVDGAAGWSVEDYLVPAATDHADIPIGSAVTVAVDAANLRTEPGLTADVTDVWLEGTPAWVVANPEIADGYEWYEVDSAGVTGWIARTNLAFESSHDFTVAVDETAIANTGYQNLRDNAGFSGAAPEILVGGTLGTVLDGPVEFDDLVWYQFETEFGTGWVCGEYLI